MLQDYSPPRAAILGSQEYCVSGQATHKFGLGRVVRPERATGTCHVLKRRLSVSEPGLPFAKNVRSAAQPGPPRAQGSA